MWLASGHCWGLQLAGFLEALQAGGVGPGGKGLGAVAGGITHRGTGQPRGGSPT